MISTSGNGRAVKYSLTSKAHLLRTIEINDYFKKEIDERIIQNTYNFELIRNLLAKTELFTDEEQERLSRPEPSTFGMLAGLGALALVGTRRRRK